MDQHAAQPVVYGSRELKSPWVLCKNVFSLIFHLYTESDCSHHDSPTTRNSLLVKVYILLA